MFGLPESGIIGLPLSSLGCDLLSKHLERVTKSVRAGATERLDAQIRRADGTPINVSFTVSPILAGDALAGLSIIARDITSQKRLEADGLAAALEEMAAHAETVFGVATVCDVVGLSRFDALAAIQLYRIAQEAVNNACKHSGATRIRISLEENHGLVRLRVEDNGCGVGCGGAAEGSGLGFKIMHYRAEIIGGVLEVSPSGTGGTIVECRTAVTLPTAPPTAPPVVDCPESEEPKWLGRAV